MNIARNMSVCVFRLKNVHFIEFLCAHRTVFQHCTHSSIAVNVGIFTFQVAVAGRLEGKILIHLHKTGIHLSRLGSFGTIQNI